MQLPAQKTGFPTHVGLQPHVAQPGFPQRADFSMHVPQRAGFSTHVPQRAGFSTQVSQRAGFSTHVPQRAGFLMYVPQRALFPTQAKLPTHVPACKYHHVYRKPLTVLFLCIAHEVAHSSPPARIPPQSTNRSASMPRDEDLLREELEVDNYREKFRILLNMEEQEHRVQLTK